MTDTHSHTNTRTFANRKTQSPLNEQTNAASAALKHKQDHINGKHEANFSENSIIENADSPSCPTNFLGTPRQQKKKKNVFSRGMRLSACLPCLLKPIPVAPLYDAGFLSPRFSTSRRYLFITPLSAFPFLRFYCPRYVLCYPFSLLSFPILHLPRFLRTEFLCPLSAYTVYPGYLLNESRPSSPPRPPPHPPLALTSPLPFPIPFPLSLISLRLFPFLLRLSPKPLSFLPIPSENPSFPLPPPLPPQLLPPSP